jgi:hypothetical protein
VHWTGGPGLGRTATLAQSAARLEEYRRLHTGLQPVGRGWKDIAYNVAFDVEGRVFDARGVEHMSAANGNQTVNASHGAALFLLGSGDPPSPAMLDAFAAWRWDVWLRAWPDARGVVGHRDLTSTDCPGPAVHQLVRAGRLTDTPVEDDDMAMTPEDRASLVEDTARRTADLITGAGARYPVLVADGTGAAELPDGRDIDSIPTVLGEIQAEQHRQARVLDQIAEMVARLEPRP